MSAANARVRAQLIARMYPLQCRYCRKALTREMATLDHLVPRSRGGKTTIRNCVIACAACNHAKADGTAARNAVLTRRFAL